MEAPKSEDIFIKGIVKRVQEEHKTASPEELKWRISHELARQYLHSGPQNWRGDPQIQHERLQKTKLLALEDIRHHTMIMLCASGEGASSRKKELLKSIKEAREHAHVIKEEDLDVLEKAVKSFRGDKNLHDEESAPILQNMNFTYKRGLEKISDMHGKAVHMQKLKIRLEKAYGFVEPSRKWEVEK